MKFSYSAVWEDAVRMMRANSALLLGIAGVFFFLPALLMGYFTPMAESSATLAERMAEVQVYFAANWGWVLIANAVNMIGAIAIYLLIFDPSDHTVRAALAKALPILPFYLVLSMLSTLLTVFGALWLILPGIYLLGRICVATVAMVAERIRSPLGALAASWRLTRGRGWAVAGIVILVVLVSQIMIIAVTSVFGSIFILLAGRDGLGGLLTLILASALGALFSLLMVLLFGAIYRALGASKGS